MNHISPLLAFAAHVRRAYAAVCKPVLAPYGLSQTSFDILMFLHNEPEHYTAREISTLLNVKPNVISTHVEELAEAGYLTRETVADDRRKVRLCLTERAAPILEKGLAIQHTFLSAMRQGLSDEDIAILGRCFRVFDRNADRLQGRG